MPWKRYYNTPITQLHFYGMIIYKVINYYLVSIENKKLSKRQFFVEIVL